MFEFFHCLVPAVRFYYDDRRDFRAPSWECQSFSLYQICGPNGHGKSTYLKILTHILEKRQPLYLGHEVGFIEEMTIAWHSQLYAFKKGLLKHPEPEQRILSLSQGQQKMVALELHLGSSGIWLLDEPFNSLDTSHRCQLWYKIEDHISQGGTVVFTDHTNSSSTNLQPVRISIFCQEAM